MQLALPGGPMGSSIPARQSGQHRQSKPVVSQSWVSRVMTQTHLGVGFYPKHHVEPWSSSPRKVVFLSGVYGVHTTFTFFNSVFHVHVVRVFVGVWDITTDEPPDLIPSLPGPTSHRSSHLTVRGAGGAVARIQVRVGVQESLHGLTE